MNMISKALGATMILGAMIGCTGQDEDTNTPVPSTINPGTKPGTPEVKLPEPRAPLRFIGPVNRSG